MKYYLEKYIHSFFYCVILLIVDLLTHFLIKGESYSLFFVITSDIFMGVIFSLMLSIKNKNLKNFFYVFINVFIILYTILSFVNIYTYTLYKNIFPFKTIAINIKNILEFYNTEILEIVSHNIVLCILFILLVTSIILISNKIYFNKNNSYLKKDEILKRALPIFIIFIISLLTTNKNLIDYESNLKINGLKYAIVKDFTNNYNYEMSYSNDDINNTESEATTTFTDNTIKSLDQNDKSIVSKEAYNVLDYDFNEIIKNETRYDYNEINKYLSTKKPTEKNDYTGLFKGKNLIMICAEAWNSNVVDEELFPTMYRLINNGFKFNNFYQPQSNSSTSAGEYAFLTGMIPVSNDYSFSKCVDNDMGFTITNKLKNEGYKTYSFHDGYSKYYKRDETHGSLMGFDQFCTIETGLSAICNKEYPNDFDMLDKTFNIISKDKPFLAYYMTYTGHMQYYDVKGKNYKNLFDKLESVYGNKYSEMVETYIVKNMFLEEGLKSLLKNLEDNNMLNDTVICMVPDHYPYGLQFNKDKSADNVNNLVELYDNEEVLTNKMLLDKTDMILWCGSLENTDKKYKKEIDKPISTIDITPTLLNLFGLDFDSRLYPGKDIFSNSEGVVIYADGRYITKDEMRDQSFLSMQRSGKYFENYVWNAINYCKFNLNKDYYSYIKTKRK